MSCSPTRRMAPPPRAGQCAAQFVANEVPHAVAAVVEGLNPGERREREAADAKIAAEFQRFR